MSTAERVEQQRLRPVVPLLLVNAVAVGGQVAYGRTAYEIDGWPGATLAVAVVAALTAESVSLYVNWHAHDALLCQATSSAARLRRTAYLIAGVVGALNYSHFAHGWQPTGIAVLTAMCSLLSPWLWGLHTRRAQRVQLHHEGITDSIGAVFSAERWWWYPRLTLGARRYSIFHGIRDPKVAWEQYITKRSAEKLVQQAERSERAEANGHRGAKYNDDEHLAAAHAWAAANPTAPITSRRQFQDAAEIDGSRPGSGRAEALFAKFRAEQDARPALTAVSGGAK